MRRLMYPAAIAALFVCGSAQAAPVLDQHSVPETGVIATSGASGFEVEPFDSFGQTFTVGMNGTLARIDLGLVQFFSDGKTNPVQFNLGVRNGPTLFSTSIPLTAIPQLHLGSTTWADVPQIDLTSAHIAVTTGEQLEFFFTPVPGGSDSPVMLSGVDTHPVTYAGGDEFEVIGSTPFFSSTQDLAFRTYVQTGVPEPASWALMLLGFGAAGGALRRGRRGIRTA